MAEKRRTKYCNKMTDKALNIIIIIQMKKISTDTISNGTIDVKAPQKAKTKPFLKECGKGYIVNKQETIQ